MPKKIYVGNLPFSASDDEVRDLVRDHGKVTGVEIRTDSQSKSAMAVIVFEGEGPNTVAQAINGRVVGGNKIVASTDRSVVINHEEQYNH